MQTARRPDSLAFWSAGNSSAASRLMMATTTRSSMRVKPITDRRLPIADCCPRAMFICLTDDHSPATQQQPAQRKQPQRTRLGNCDEQVVHQELVAVRADKDVAEG